MVETEFQLLNNVLQLVFISTQNLCDCFLFTIRSKNDFGTAIIQSHILTF